MSDERAVQALAGLGSMSGASARATRQRLMRAIASGRDLVGATAAAEGLLGVKAWTSGAHPRAPKGSAAGGQFIAAQGSGTHERAASGAEKLLGKKLTRAHIEAFQRAHGLKVDGVIGHQTAAALLGSHDASKLKPGTMSEQQRRQLARYMAVRGSATIGSVGSGSGVP